tara:strand:+ start:4399 stop:4566 length:168 start_codon:yes stop_codon:yes gene_type:complete
MRYIIFNFRNKNILLFVFEVSKEYLFTLVSLATFDYQLVTKYSTLAKMHKKTPTN